MTFVGFVGLGQNLVVMLQTIDSNRQPVEPDAAPAWQAYAAEGVLPAVNGTTALAHVVNITGATNANPIVVTAANHGLVTGTRARIRNVTGNTNANGVNIVTRIDANTFSVPVAGNGGYAGGGTVEVIGLYSATIVVSGGSGFDSDKNFFVRYAWLVGGAARAAMQTFTVT